VLAALASGCAICRVVKLVEAIMAAIEFDIKQVASLIEATACKRLQFDNVPLAGQLACAMSRSEAAAKLS
jgi:hypothetical protein